MITVQIQTSSSVEKVWEYWTNPIHILKWNTASEDWHTTKAENDLRIGGKFLSHMEAKDKSFGFDFTGVYTALNPNQLIEYTMGDGRKAVIKFEIQNQKTMVTESFDAETENSEDLQKAGWQAILNNFKNYVENN